MLDMKSFNLKRYKMCLEYLQLTSHSSIWPFSLCAVWMQKAAKICFLLFSIDVIKTKAMNFDHLRCEMAHFSINNTFLIEHNKLLSSLGQTSCCRRTNLCQIYISGWYRLLLHWILNNSILLSSLPIVQMWLILHFSHRRLALALRHLASRRELLIV